MQQKTKKFNQNIKKSSIKLHFPTDFQLFRHSRVSFSKMFLY